MQVGDGGAGIAEGGEDFVDVLAGMRCRSEFSAWCDIAAHPGGDRVEFGGQDADRPAGSHGMMWIPWTESVYAGVAIGGGLGGLTNHYY
ncbi:hypothetical protein IU500_19500 [Nocardia terpenica]|uniref:hypothetical protein n=1 Tax=Nocardia terpenica TaxID=455432 RepID=UPI001893ACB5|nr:hypothetical protein [Nocardia terpenica]MBF6061975.1 hypothetical protein [Nocardia terpenica]MBF6106225.1 hypothetical protein [Nocardia terpenica]MBF6110395.1 hypothetical protein [Nocardia terpenica]MBF6120768.1 hypothetical protein [Nocardia terpenica]MBF6151731.1 hypothetical protein [Nocardia terpenica]